MLMLAHCSHVQTQHTHAHTHTCSYTSVPEPHHHLVEWNMFSAILSSSQMSGIHIGTGETPIYTAVLSSVQLEIYDEYQMRSTIGS